VLLNLKVLFILIGTSKSKVILVKSEEKFAKNGAFVQSIINIKIKKKKNNF
jgi:hypothetical protein